MKNFLLSFFALVLLNHNASSQCSMVPVSLNSRVSNSSLIVEGTVINKRSFWNAEHNYIYTSNLLEVYKVFKGSAVSYQLEVITEGGQIDLFKQTVEPSLQLNVGQTGMFVLNPSSQASQFKKSIYSVYADAQGFIKYDQNSSSATDMFNTYPSVENDLYEFVQQATGTAAVVLQPNIKGSAQKPNSSNSIAAITGISPTTITAGTATSLTVTGTGFGATQGTSYVEFPDADAGAGYVQPHATQYLSWSANQIVVEVPTKTSSGGTLTTSGTAGTGQIRVVVAGTPTLSAQTLTITYGHLNVYYTTGNAIYNTRHVNLNGLGGITWQMYTGFDVMAAPKAAFQRAFQSWRCATLINWALGAPVATNTIAFDGVNVIRFDIGAELPAGVLGRCTSYFSGCITGTVVAFYVSELDICFDDATNWQYGPAAPAGAQYDFESVTLHELGHGHQLSHVIIATDVMNYSIANAVSKRVLNVDDIAGGNAVMTRNTSGGVCAKPVMTAISASACAAGAPTVAFNIAPSATICAGQSITLTDVSAGSPTAWSWTLTGGAPATSTLQNQVVSYAAPGVYTIAHNATNGFGTSATLTKTISVLANPTVTASNTGPYCVGATIQLNASAAASYTWSGPGTFTSNIQNPTRPAATVTMSGTYNLVVAAGSCTASATTNVLVNPLPTPTASNNSPVCVGQTINFTGSAGVTYTWTGPSSFTMMVQNPTIPSAALSNAGTYTCSVTDANGCKNSVTTNVFVNSPPAAPSLGSNSPVCAGQNLNLVCGPTAAVTFMWSGPCGFTSATQNPTIPNVTTCSGGIYTCTITSASGCTNSASTSVSITPSPVINVTSNPGSICVGQSSTLTASGASTYTFNPGGTTTNPLVVSPTVTANYTVSGTASGCTVSVPITVTVSTCVGIETNSTGSGAISVYPNPTQNNITINFGKPSSGKVVVYDAIGQEVMSKNLNEVDAVSLDLSAYSKGIYFVHIKQGGLKESIVKVIRD